VQASPSTQLRALPEIQHHLSLELEAEASVPCDGLSSDKPRRSNSSALKWPVSGVHSKLGQAALSKPPLTID
jgi:hypothetical protein